MEKLLIIAISPIIIFLIYIYIKDKYEKEPKPLAIIGTIYGILISIPIVFTEKYVMMLAPNKDTIYYAFFVSFIVASFVEETYKYIIVKFLIEKNNNYNEPFDGILYAVFVSLGFSLIENILYVLHPSLGGLDTGLARAIFSVPAHGIFAIYMGYYLSNKKFLKKGANILALSVPIFIHGIYDLLLFPKMPYSNIFFVLFYIYISINSIIMIKKYIKISPFKKSIKKN